MCRQGNGGQHHPTPPASSALAHVFQAQRFHHFSCKVCFYHCKFRNSARWCQDPCIWLENEQACLQLWPWQLPLESASFLYGRGILGASFSLTREQRLVFSLPPEWTLVQGCLSIWNVYHPITFSSHHYEWKFCIADVSRPLLGADFL